MRIKSYGLIAWNTFKENTTYKKNTISSFFFRTISLMIRILVWVALYASIDNQPLMGRSLTDMLTYTVVVFIVTVFTDGGQVANLLEQRMISGEIAFDALRPTSPRLMLAAQSWGDKMLEIFINIIPVCICIVWLGGIQTPGLAQWLLFIASLCLGYVINLLFAFVTGCFAFYYTSVQTLSWFISFFTLAMSGAIVPLWMLPDWLRAVALALPFQATVYIPMSIYMGTADFTGLTQTLAVQMLWIAGLGMLQQILWKAGLRRIVVHGG